MMTKNILCASATPVDAGDIARLHVASLREADEGMIPSEILANVDVEDRTTRWRDYLAANGYPTFVARVEGQAAGFIRAGRLAQPLSEGADGHIYALYILRAFHRRGIGRKLMGMTATAWLGQGGRALSVGVLSANHGARSFYEALGARFVRPDVYEWQGHQLPESIYILENLPELARFA